LCDKAKGVIMRRICLVLAAVAAIFGSAVTYAGDYDPRFVRNYPPGFHGMWYYAQRFYKENKIPKLGSEKHHHDRFMSGVTNLIYPFYPIPYDWEYGTGRTFGLPDYNKNCWR
jgi:hypothetical protein